MAKKTLIFDENNLLNDLNAIADFVIGNECLEDLGYKNMIQLPEILAFVMTHPDDLRAMQSARGKIRLLAGKINEIEQKLDKMIKRKEIKEKI